jgi:type II secretory pathway pseudopilin PulG
VALAVLTVALAASSMLFSVSYYHAEQAAQQRQAAQQQAAQRQQGAALERKLCTSLDRLAALKPPPGSAADNPSRAYLQQQHAVLAELGPDVGCEP